MSDNKEITQKVKDVISLYAEKMIASGKENAIEQLRSYSSLAGGIGCYINGGDVSEKGEYSGGYAILKYAGIEYNPKTNELDVNYPEGQLPMGIDLMAWVLEIEQKLNGELDINAEPKQEYFYIGGVNGGMTKVVSKKEYQPDPTMKTKADILDTLLSRSEVVIKK